MKNEPVAWYNADDSSLSFKNHGGGWQPLYTHPANPYQSITNTKIEPTVVSYTHPVKELTDEEIVWLWCDCEKTGTGATYINFARAILRKAQEK